MSDYVFLIVNDSPKVHDRGYDIGIKSWKNYCNKHDLKLFIYKHEDENVSPIWYKYRVFDILKSRGLEYDRILYADCDTIVSPHCPNMLELTNKLGVVHNFGSLDWVIRSLENYGQLLPEVNLSYTDYFNAGIILFNKDHEKFFSDIEKWRKDNWEVIQRVIATYKSGQEQTFFNLLVRKHNIPIKYLSYKFNVQDLARREVFRTDGIGEPYFWTDPMYGYVFHFNAIPNNHRQLMQGVYDKLWATSSVS